MPRRGPLKYQPLADYLAALPAETVSVTLPFAEIEALIGGDLPAAAAARPWWVDLTRTQAWRATGWRVASASLLPAVERVTFARADSTARRSV